MGMNVDNCPRCGKLYVVNHRRLCPACMKEVDEQLVKCHNYLRDNRKSTIQELSEATGVSTAQITRFIREGRISIADTPNLYYECEVCGAPIRTNKICGNCRDRLTKKLTQVREETERDHERKKQEEHISYRIKDRLEDRLRKPGEGK